MIRLVVLLLAAVPARAARATPLGALSSDEGTVNASNATRQFPPMTLEEKQAADAASAAADNRVTHLEKERDEAWQHSRGNLAVMSSPPVRSASVFALLSAETDKFAVSVPPAKSNAHRPLSRRIADLPSCPWQQLEGAIKQAKDVAAHKRRVAELAGGAWDALESKRLKLLRLQAAEAGLAAARAAEAKARADEAELLRELALERARDL